MRLLLVDDDAGLRALVRTTFEIVDVEVREAESTRVAEALIRAQRPDAIVLDVSMPGENGFDFCRRLKDDPATSSIPVVLLSGSVDGTSPEAASAGADAFLPKPFSPLQLLALVERLAGGVDPVPLVGAAPKGVDAQLLMYARDLRQLLELERGQRVLLQSAYHETVAALASALESKDTGTRAHSQRVQEYALALSAAVAPDLTDDPGTEYGFLLHDVGKIGIPDSILQKPGSLTDEERRLMQSHAVLGEQMLGGVAFLKGTGLSVVRHHHERWDGGGYPDRLEGTDIPIGARIFAVADTLDAMTSNRPYRRALSWADAGKEILGERGRQFDPDVVRAFRQAEPRLREIHRQLAAA